MVKSKFDIEKHFEIIEWNGKKFLVIRVWKFIFKINIEVEFVK